MPNYFLTDNDRRLIEEFLREKRNQVTRQVSQPERDTQSSPQIFIAKPTGAKIDALNGSTDVPGVSTCDFYRILDTEAGDPSLEQMDMPARDVYNISEDEIDQQWTVVMKTSHGKYVALWAGVKATHVEFTLTSAMALTDETSTGATVNNYWGGANPGTTVTVFNKNVSADKAFEGPTGAKGIAIHDVAEDNYRIVFLEPIATIIKCTTNGAVAQADANITVDGVATIEPRGAKAPTVTSVTNFLSLPAPNDTDLFAIKVGAAWWGILPIPWETLTAVTDVDYASLVLSKKTTTILGINKGSESSPITITTATECP